MVAKKVFNQVDNALALGGETRKGTRWGKDGYFKVQGSRRWVFSTVEKYANGKVREYTLLKESDTPIVRYVKIKAASNPHAPNWDEYFEFRRGKTMLIGEGTSEDVSGLAAARRPVFCLS